MSYQDDRTQNAAGHTTYVPPTAPLTTFEQVHRDVRDAPPKDPADLFKRVLKVACPDERQLNRLIYDADAQAAKADGRAQALLRTTDLPPFLNEGKLPPGVEPLVAVERMPELSAIYDVPDWDTFKQLVATRTLSQLEAKRKLYENKQKPATVG